MTILYRADPIEGLALRADEAGGPGILHGTVMRYGDTAQRPGFLERFAPGSLAPYERGVLARYMHQRHMPLALLGGAMTMTDDEERMEVSIVLPRDAIGERTARQVEERILQGLSAEFAPLQHRIEDDRRTVVHTSAVLVGVGVVDIPSYPDSTVRLRHELLSAAVPPEGRRPWL